MRYKCNDDDGDDDVTLLCLWASLLVSMFDHDNFFDAAVELVPAKDDRTLMLGR